MDPGELATRWTVRVAMVLFVASLASRRRWPIWSRLTWTAGCIAYLLHVAAAFHYYHHWSHAEAYAFTAQQTWEVVGLDWGGGLYVNYVFTAVWLGDVLWWWSRGWRDPHPRPFSQGERGVKWLVHGFMGFVAFNATVVFATGFSRWFGIGACAVLAVVMLLPKKEGRHADKSDP